ncbi:MAG: DoxX family protein [Ignavibacteriales bacterium]|nr:DoxX family protein [Ignavibacteriales bacterium]
MSKTRKIAGWVLASLLFALLLMSGVMKILASGSSDSEVVKSIIKYGLEGKIILIATGELVSALLFLIPKTSSLGTLLLSSHFGGAIATHMEHGEAYFPVVVILLLMWVTNYLRNPEMLSSFKRKK